MKFESRKRKVMVVGKREAGVSWRLVRKLWTRLKSSST